ncbi:17485_t:CDS:2, partial [Dentiscutata erythropus]
KNEKSEKATEIIQKHLDVIKKRIPTFKAALTKAIKKTYKITTTAKNAHLVLDDGKKKEITHIKDQLEEIDEVIIFIKDLQNDLEFYDKIIDDYRIKSQEVEVQLEENINHAEIDKISLRDLKYSVDDLNIPHSKLPNRINKDCISFNVNICFSDETSQVVGTPNKGHLTDFLWVDGEYITEVSYMKGKYINGIEIKTNGGRSTGWQGSHSGRKERIIQDFLVIGFQVGRDYMGLFLKEY